MKLIALSLTYLWSRPLAAALNLLLLALGLASITLVLLTSVQIDRAFERDLAGIDVVVGAKGSPMQLILAGVFHIDTPTGNIPLAEVKELQKNPQIAKLIPLSLGDSFRGFRFVGTTTDYVTHYDAKLAQGVLWQQPMEAVLGANVATSTAMAVGNSFIGSHGLGMNGHAHGDNPYKVTGVLAPCGCVLDRLILTATESVWRVHEKAIEGDTPLDAQDKKAIEEDREKIDATMDGNEPDVTALLDRVGAALSGLTQGASLVLTPKHEAPIRHIEFVSLGAHRALVVLVFGDGHVENRVFTPPPGQTPSSMREAANFLNALAEGRTLSELRTTVAHDITTRRQEIDELARALVDSGLALWENPGEQSERLIVRGQSNLIGGGAEGAEVDRIRSLFDDLERKRDIAEFLDLTEGGDGVKIFIGSENKLFSLSGSSLVVSPYMNADRRIIGAVGVIGPTRLNYARVVPIVNYTAQLVGRLVSERGKG